jgi:hypothetical protein
MPRPPAAKSNARNDGWGTPETGFNKLGTYIMGLPAVFAAMISGGMFGGFEMPVEILCVVVGICGVIGGVINIMGRGPLVAGAVVGLVTALGAYGAVAWWIFGRKRVYIVEVSLAFIVGAIPGMALQYGLQQFLKKKRGA